MTAVWWFLAGTLVALLGIGALYLLRRWLRRRRYGLPIAHEEMLVQYGRQMASLLDRRALAQLLAVEVPGAMDVTEAVVLLSEGHDLVATGDRGGHRG